MDHPKTKANPLFLREEELRQSIELLFFAYRDFTAEPDAILDDFGFGRAHHRVIYFVGRNRGITVTQLLDILKITKQSLSRVLGQLVEEGFIVQETDEHDRRRRLLQLTSKGHRAARHYQRRRPSLGPARQFAVRSPQSFRDVTGGSAPVRYNRRHHDR